LGAAGADIINLPTTVGTITLSETLPTIISDITLNGNGWTISGNDSVRIFVLNRGAFTVNNATLTKGKTSGDGGVIFIGRAVFNLNDSVISDNNALGHGGAISNSGTVTIVNSVFSNNTAAESDGGAIYNNGSLSIARSAFSGNQTTHAIGFGGAIFSSPEADSLTIANSTFYSNSSAQGGAISIGSGTNTLTHLTITGNTASVSKAGGGLSISAAEGPGEQSAAQWAGDPACVTLRNSLLSGNSGDDCQLDAVNTLRQSGNLIRTGSCGTAASSADPDLPESATGSPPIFALPTDSPAVNAVACIEGIAADQRGIPRPQPAEGMCDIGAFEYAAAGVATQDSSDSLDGVDCELNTPTATPTATDTPVGGGDPSGDGGDPPGPPDPPDPVATASPTATATAGGDLPTNGEPPTDGDPPTDGEPRTNGDPPTITPKPTFIPQATATATLPPIHTYPINERIMLRSANSDIRSEALQMLDLGKHPGLQGGRLAARVWRANRQCAHRISGGESLFRLAIRYNTTAETLKRHNYLPSDLIVAGQELALPVCAPGMMALQYTRICFKADGALVFVDTAVSPPTLHSLETFKEDGSTCAAITRPGTIVLTDLRQSQ
jgi:predicted outer membrane repeat protein